MIALSKFVQQIGSRSLEKFFYRTFGIDIVHKNTSTTNNVVGVSFGFNADFVNCNQELESSFVFR